MTGGGARSQERRTAAKTRGMPLYPLLTPRTPSVDGWRLHIEENTTGTGLGGYSPENSFRFSSD